MFMEGGSVGRNGIGGRGDEIAALDVMIVPQMLLLWLLLGHVGRPTYMISGPQPHFIS